MQRDASHETSLPEKPASGTLHDDVLLGRSITDLTMSPANGTKSGKQERTSIRTPAAGGFRFSPALGDRGGTSHHAEPASRSANTLSRIPAVATGSTSMWKCPSSSLRTGHPRPAARLAGAS
jgi:hypothetical protein